MKNVSFWKKIGLFNFYLKTIRKNRKELTDNFNLRTDRVGRLYTVINIPEKVFEEPYNIKTSDINTLSERYIKEYSTEIMRYLNSKGLTELFEFYDIQKVDKYSYLYVLGFSLFKTDKAASNFIFKILPIVISVSVILFFFHKYKLLSIIHL